MKTSNNFSLIYILLVIAQMVICNYFKISPYVYVTVLPVLILCIPARISTALCMLIAFATGTVVDALSEGIIGLNALALVPVALIRHSLLRFVLGDDEVQKDGMINIHTTGFGKILLSITVAYSLFLAVYIIADGAGVRPLWFNASRFAASLACDSILALAVLNIINSKDR